MKKKIIIFISITIIVLLGVAIGVLKLTKPEGKKSEISELGDGIYKEIISSNNKSSISGHTIYDGIFYYLERKDLNSEEGEYYLNTLNYKTGKKSSTKISDDKTLYCYLDRQIITCNNDSKNIAYDLNMNKVIDEKTNDDYYEAIIPCQDSYWRYVNGTLKNGKEEKKIPGYDETFVYTDYLNISDNIYLLLKSSNEFYIYDITSNSLTNTHESKYFKYSEGYCFYTSTYYHIYDFNSQKDEKYEVSGLVAPKTSYLGAIIDNKIYQMSNATNLLEMYNINNNKVSSFDISKYISYPLTNVDYKDGAILLTTFLDEEIEFVVIEIDNHKLKEKNIYDYTLEQNKEIENMVKNIKDKYNVNIKIKDEGEVDFPDFYSQTLYNNGVIKSALVKIDEILYKFPEHFFEEFTHDMYKGLNIYVSGSLTPADTTTQASNPVAYTLMYDSSYTIVLDSFYSEFENTVCHELMHAMENNLNNKNKNIFTKWNSLNPSNFSYYDNYNGYHYYEYTPYLASNNKVYFVSDYSYTFAKEDRAEIFGKMCSEDTNDDLKRYPNLYKKAQAIREELIKQYPELENSIVLDNYK